MGVCTHACYLMWYCFRGTGIMGHYYSSSYNVGCFITYVSKQLFVIRKCILFTGKHIPGCNYRGSADYICVLHIWRHSLGQWCQYWFQCWRWYQILYGSSCTDKPGIEHWRGKQCWCDRSVHLSTGPVFSAWSQRWWEAIAISGTCNYKVFAWQILVDKLV